MHLDAAMRASGVWEHASVKDSWSDIVSLALVCLGGEASLQDLFLVIGKHPRAKLGPFRAKVRHVLLKSDEYLEHRRGRWMLVDLLMRKTLPLPEGRPRKTGRQIRR